MSIPFTQFLRPNGQPRDVVIEAPAEVEQKADEILKAGLVFHCEELTTGHASFTIFDPNEEKDLAHALCMNGPDVPATVYAMILDFDLSKHL